MKKEKHSNKLLLLEDVINLGRKGELVKAKPGFIRNFLLPKKKAVLADKRMIRLQQKLKEERAKQAALDKKESEALAARVKGKTMTIRVKADREGHLYGSVTAADIVKFLEKEESILCERRSVLLSKPIKMVGNFEIRLCLKEEVSAYFFLKVVSEDQIETVKTEVEVTREKDVQSSDKEQSVEHPDEKAKEE